MNTDRGDAVDGDAENALQSIHGMNVGHADGRQHGQVDDAHAAAEIAAVHRNDQFENRCAHDGSGGGVMSEHPTHGCRASFLPKMNNRVAPSISQGSTRMKVWAGVRSSRNAPTTPPIRLVTRSGTSTRRGTSRRLR